MHVGIFWSYMLDDRFCVTKHLCFTNLCVHITSTHTYVCIISLSTYNIWMYTDKFLLIRIWLNNTEQILPSTNYLSLVISCCKLTLAISVTEILPNLVHYCGIFWHMFLVFSLPLSLSHSQPSLSISAMIINNEIIKINVLIL